MKILVFCSLFLANPVFSQSQEIVALDKKNLQFQKMSNQELEIKIRKSIKDNGITDELKRRLAWVLEDKRRLDDDEQLISIRETIDKKIIETNPQYLSCDENTPTVSLEEKVPFPGAGFQGPFFGVHRDHQRTYETCYANTAKNLLVGISKGKDVASFLDLALLTKGDGGVATSGLAGGESCSVLNHVEESGYCPQDYAPLEKGEKNVFIDGLLGTTGTEKDQAFVVRLMEEFLSGQNKLAKTNKELSEKIMKQAKIIAEQLKARPNVKIPLPVVRSQIPGQWKLKAMLHANPSLNKDQFLADFKNEYRQFYPQYIRAVVEGKNRNQIFDVYRAKMKPFIDKYKIAEQVESWKEDFIEDTEDDWTNPKLKKELAESVAFLKGITGQKDATDGAFLKYCDETFSESFDSIPFLNSMQPLIKHLNTVNVDPAILFTEDGGMKSPADLMQLLVAPSCLNPANRKSPSEGILCEQGVSTVSLIRALGKTPEIQTKLMRERVIASLLQGYALGNQIQGHINTIVGMRFNPEKKQCEILIRESQTGTSTWQPEKSIYTDIRGLTEVRRK